jgi:hypothetical protein
MAVSCVTESDSELEVNLPKRKERKDPHSEPDD